MSFDFGAMLNGGGLGGEAGMGAGLDMSGMAGGGGMDFMQRLLAATSNPAMQDQLLTQLAMSGVAPPTGPLPDMSGTMGGPSTPIMPTTPVNTPPAMNPLLSGAPPAAIPVGPSPIQSTIAGLTAPPQGQVSVPGGVGDQSPKPPGLGQLLAGAQTAMKGMEQPQQQRQMAPSPGGVGAHGSAALAKSPGYLPTSQAVQREQSRRSLGMLLGGR